MELHQLKSPVGSRRKKIRVGRGGATGVGRTSGRGQKGQHSRSGGWAVKGSEGGQMRLIRRLPKFGFRSKRPILYQVVNVSQLNQLDKQVAIDAEILKSCGLIKSLQKPYKILGDGELTKSLTVRANAFSKSAQGKIEKAGGKVELIEKSIEKSSGKNDSVN